MFMYTYINNHVAPDNRGSGGSLGPSSVQQAPPATRKTINKH